MTWGIKQVVLEPSVPEPSGWPGKAHFGGFQSFLVPTAPRPGSRVFILSLGLLGSFSTHCQNATHRKQPHLAQWWHYKPLITGMAQAPSNLKEAGRVLECPACQKLTLHCSIIGTCRVSGNEAKVITSQPVCGYFITDSWTNCTSGTCHPFLPFSECQSLSFPYTCRSSSPLGGEWLIK